MRDSELSDGVAALKMRFFATLRMTKSIRNSEFGIRNYGGASRIKDEILRYAQNDKSIIIICHSEQARTRAVKNLNINFSKKFFKNMF